MGSLAIVFDPAVTTALVKMHEITRELTERL